jgi:hypothetical protein
MLNGLIIRILMVDCCCATNRIAYIVPLKSPSILEFEKTALISELTVASLCNYVV